MITENDLAALSYGEAPKIITDHIPGPEGEKIHGTGSRYFSTGLR